MFKLPTLPFEKTDLEPHISAETLDYHYDKHHATYVKKLNALVEGTDLRNKPLESIIQNSEGAIFNNASQVWNHTFYWNCLAKNAGGEPTGEIAKAIDTTYGSFSTFQSQWNDSAVNNFGSSWTWLVKNADGSLAIVNTSNAQSPLTDANVTPLMTVDLWEHAYYIDYRNARPDYLKAFWALVNWEFVNNNFAN